MGRLPQLEAMFDYFYRRIRNTAEYEVNSIRTGEKYPSLITGDSESCAMLAQYLTSDEAIDALKRKLEIVGQSAIYDLMGLLQGEGPDEYEYRLTDKVTGEDLDPISGYRDEWTDFVYVRDEGIEE